MTKRDKFETTYAVGSGDVSVTVTIGNGQFGKTQMWLDYLSVGTDHIELSGPKLKKKLLEIKSVVTDINDQTNRMTVKYVLRGGKKDETHTRRLEVDQNGDAAIFDAEVKFK